jgi:hypothetical protein
MKHRNTQCVEKPVEKHRKFKEGVSSMIDCQGRKTKDVLRAPTPAGRGTEKALHDGPPHAVRLGLGTTTTGGGAAAAAMGTAAGGLGANNGRHTVRKTEKKNAAPPVTRGPSTRRWSWRPASSQDP